MKNPHHHKPGRSWLWISSTPAHAIATDLSHHRWDFTFESQVSTGSPLEESGFKSLGARLGGAVYGGTQGDLNSGISIGSNRSRAHSRSLLHLATYLNPENCNSPTDLAREKPVVSVCPYHVNKVIAFLTNAFAGHAKASRTSTTRASGGVPLCPQCWRSL